MSKILYICYRNKTIDKSTIKKVKKISDSIVPNDIEVKPIKIFAEENIIYSIVNPHPDIISKGSSIVLGNFFENIPDWEKTTSHQPDGNYVMFRANSMKLEVLTDFLGSRNVWYYFDDHMIVLSSSQKAIVSFLGDFHFDPRVIPWMISTGTLGRYGWDQRIKKISPNGKVIIDRKRWQLQELAESIQFHPSPLPKKNYKNLLETALLDTFKNLNAITSLKNWAVTLSGGHDSRGILLLLSNTTKNKSIRTITWGTKNSLLDPSSDSAISKKLSNIMGTKHTFYDTQKTKESMEMIIERFLINGEGEIDHLAGYLDGFLLWKNMWENGITGIIRGDEVFGYSKVNSPLMVKKVVGLTLCQDYKNLKKYPYIQALEQKIPDDLVRRDKESLSLWRDRIYQGYRIPTTISALADLKYSYVEQINPFLSKKIVKIVRQIPDNLRTNKKLFRAIMKKYDIKVPYASKSSNASLLHLLRDERIVAILRLELESEYATKIFPSSFLSEINSNLNTENDSNQNISKSNKISRLKAILPIGLKRALTHNKYLSLDNNHLAFRIFIICRIHRYMQEKN
ncbi:hypothetical protein [Autumnicola edwardsiae]|uniref:asparagine synthase (glutamine-hydrolyzing) n=1 Tax=Autumnicola edwardsiae TaxID=3075594 RepID=A0ABU3CTF2_9FLAO|nr:hypothetical protein [Zunongwangia sp. F297]MDT0649638.1 hypothetical protein [Zunongwangia sp. F297]